MTRTLHPEDTSQDFEPTEEDMKRAIERLKEAEESLSEKEDDVAEDLSDLDLPVGEGYKGVCDVPCANLFVNFPTKSMRHSTMHWSKRCPQTFLS